MISWILKILWVLLGVIAAISAAAGPLEMAHDAEHHHDFEAAEVLLREALAEDPRNGHAWINLASLSMVRGDIRAARVACGRAAAHVELLATLGCRGRIALATGRVEASLLALRELVDHSIHHHRTDRVYGWVVGVTAELALASGDPAAAEAYFRRALALGAPGSLRGSWLDFLLSERRYEEVLRQVPPYDPDVALLLRRTLALVALERHWQASALITYLDEVFRSWMANDDFTHGREMARFYLDAFPQPALAARAAEENYRHQRERLDLSLYQRASTAVANH